MFSFSEQLSSLKSTQQIFNPATVGETGSNIFNVIVYGVGSIDESQVAMCQLSLAILLARELQVGFALLENVARSPLLEIM